MFGDNINFSIQAMDMAKLHKKKGNKKITYVPNLNIYIYVYYIQNYTQNKIVLYRRCNQLVMLYIYN